MVRDPLLDPSMNGAKDWPLIYTVKMDAFVEEGKTCPLLILDQETKERLEIFFGHSMADKSRQLSLVESMDSFDIIIMCAFKCDLETA